MVIDEGDKMYYSTGKMFAIQLAISLVNMVAAF
jgi:hypothetical protein